MDLEPETLVHHPSNNANNASVDIDNELREFLESGRGHVEHDIEHMLLE